MAINPIKILIEVLDSVQPTVNISNVEDLGGGSYKLTVDNSFYLRALKRVTIDGTLYKITDFEIDDYLTVIAEDGSDVPVTVDSFTIEHPSFYYGNPQMVSAEILKRQENGTLTWPYIWAVEISNSQKNINPSAAVKTTKSFNLFFFDSVNLDNWTIEDHYNQDIYPLSNYIDYFFSVLKSRRDVFDADSITWNENNHVNFGEYIVDEGMKDRILADDITGIQVQAEVPFMDRGCSSRDIVPKCAPVKIFENGILVATVEAGGSYSYTT